MRFKVNRSKGASGKKKCLNHSRFNSLTNKATLAFSQWKSKQWFQTILFNLQAGLLGDKAFSFFTKEVSIPPIFRISFSKLCTFFRTTATRTQTFFKVCSFLFLYLLPQSSNIDMYAHWKSENARNFITFSKTHFYISIKPLWVYKWHFYFSFLKWCHLLTQAEQMWVTKKTINYYIQILYDHWGFP